MNNVKRTYLMALLVSVSATALTAPSYGAEQTAQGPAALEEIVVNARRVEENVQTVPIAITTFTETTLQQNDIRTVTDLQRSIPGLQVCCGPGNGTNAQFLRGIPGVVGYFADVPTPLNGYGLFFDLANVQALKGPQGTLFGLSTDGGAILYVPKKPTDRVEGYAQGTIGTYNRAGFEGALNVPVIGDKLLARAAITVNHTDGYLTDLSTNTDLGDQNYWAGRLSLLARPTENLENYFIFNYYNFHGRPLPAILTAVNPTGAAAARFGLANLNAALATQQALGPYKLTGLSVPGTYSKTEQTHLVNTTTWNVSDNFTVKNIFGYIRNQGFTRQDIEGTQFQISDSAQPVTLQPGATPTWSEELQVQGKLFNDLSYTIGTFHSGNVTQPVRTAAIALGNTSSTYAKTSGQTHAVYGQADYDLGAFLEGLKITAGYRYSWDIRRSQQVRFNAAGAPVSDSGVLLGYFSAGSYTVSLSYQATPDTMLFVTNSKGYSSGGFNLTAPASLQRYNPESLNNIEAGVKSQWSWNGIEARTNLSGYYGFYDSVQVSTTRQVQTPTGPVLAVVIDNAATAHLYGLEGEFTIVPTKSVELSGNFSFFKNRYDQYMTLSAAGTPVDNSGLGFVYAPKWKYTINGTYHLPVDASWGDISYHIAWTWQSSVITQPRNPLRDVDGITHFGNLNMSLDWRNPVGVEGLEASVFATNVNGNRWTQGGFGAYDALGVLGRFGDQPRMFGAKVRYSF
ncbi:MAG: hypothetical protein K2P94_03800 [Rhodospirillaceae bacterium]|nr:hypothetical protein [Rhodospirillaceae bacterium]